MESCLLGNEEGFKSIRMTLEASILVNIIYNNNKSKSEKNIDRQRNKVCLAITKISYRLERQFQTQ